MESSKLDEEKLREASCYGDLEAVNLLLKKGVNINSQHNINGWTALHWAAKRNHLEIARYLLNSGADKNSKSFAKETPADLSTSPAMLNLLGSPLKESKLEEREPSSIIPHYLNQPNQQYKVDLLEEKQIASVPLHTSLPLKELVFKLRIAYSTDTDFIEVEIDRAGLTYSQFLAVCCLELGLNSKYVDRLRKLPNTKLRKDKDVQRLKDYEEIEVVLVGSKPKLAYDAFDSNPNIVGPGLKNQNQTILY